MCREVTDNGERDIVGAVVPEVEQRARIVLCQLTHEPRDLAIAPQQLLLQQCERRRLVSSLPLCRASRMASTRCRAVIGELSRDRWPGVMASRSSCRICIRSGASPSHSTAVNEGFNRGVEQAVGLHQRPEGLRVAFAFTPGASPTGASRSLVFVPVVSR